ncbi:MAG: hypothetical protein IKV61_01380 [Clostridia bacterium]|nr:hypothetical protein [Clostridia bacterium]
MLGVSLSYAKLNNGEYSDLLPKLKDQGVKSIELRTVPPSACSGDVLRIAKNLWNMGFQVTIHADPQTEEDSLKNVFEPLKDLLNALRQSELIIVLHPVNGDNVKMLTNLSNFALTKNYPIKFALENNRKMPDKTDGDTTVFVLDIVKQVNRENVGICFDMGHYAWYSANFKCENKLPAKEFLKRVIHTHIHSYSERTHFPIESVKEPLLNYINALPYTYVGVYNIELEHRRFAHLFSEEDGLITSINSLKSVYPLVAKIYDNNRQNYDKWFKNSLEIFDKNEGCFGSLISPSSYLFSTNGYKWAMDVAFLALYDIANTPKNIKEYFKDLNCYFLTHGHRDHFEDRTISALKDSDITFIVPTFLMESALYCGIKRERIIEVKEGDEFKVGPLSVKVLQGRHFRKENGKGVDCVGYLIKGENVPTLAFPADVRDYSLNDYPALNADHCFAHIWLTDNALDYNSYFPLIKDFTKFMLNASQKSMFLTHLYRNREENFIWTEKHAELVESKILKVSPTTSVHIPKYGEIFKL